MMQAPFPGRDGGGAPLPTVENLPRVEDLPVFRPLSELLGTAKPPAPRPNPPAPRPNNPAPPLAAPPTPRPEEPARTVSVVPPWLQDTPTHPAPTAVPPQFADEAAMLFGVPGPVLPRPRPAPARRPAHGPHDFTTTPPMRHDLPHRVESPRPPAPPLPNWPVLAAPPPRRRTGRRRRKPGIARWILGALAIAATTAVLVFWWHLRQIDKTLPSVEASVAESLPTASFVYAADGTELARYGLENRIWVDLPEISKHVVDALLATEDRKFYDHGGVHWRRFLTAGWRSLRGSSQGASTLTMQLARNLYPEVARFEPLDRKLREIRMAARLERTFTKTQILELYLNRMSFGHGAYGIEAAARTYFSKTAATLDLGEAAVLVGILKGPSFYDPLHNPERALERRNFVLTNLQDVGRLTNAGASTERARPLTLRPASPTSATNPAPHFSEYVRSVVEEWGRANGYDMYRDGLRVFTTLDPYLQRYAANAVAQQAPQLQDIVARDWMAGGLPFEGFWRENGQLEEQLLRRSARFAALRRAGVDEGEAAYDLRHDPVFMDSLRTATTRLEAGLVVLDPHSGFVRAWVGSRDFDLDQFDKVGSARRQPGSTFKPFLYAAALEAGYSPSTLAEDVVRDYRQSDGSLWRPQNAGGGASGRVMTLREALSSSRNTVAARLILAVGPQRVERTAQRMGITSPLLPVPSLALGTSEVTLLELVSGLGTIVSGGTHHAPIVVSRIEDADGNVLARFEPTGTAAISARTAYTLLDMMRDVLRPGGTGFSVRGEFGLTGDLAGKTGTTQDNTDGWFVLLHPQMVVGSWVGFNQPSVHFRSNYWGQGGHNAARFVADFARQVMADPASGLYGDKFPVPPGYTVPTGDRFRGNLVDEERVRELRERETQTLPGLEPGSRGTTVW